MKERSSYITFMTTSFHTWLESRDPELFVILEAEWRRRDSRGKKTGTALGVGAAALALGLGWWGMSGKTDDVQKPTHAPTTMVQKSEDHGAPTEYTGRDKEAIFRYACERSHDGVNIFPYFVGSTQKGLIARVSVSKSERQPLEPGALKDRYYSFVSQIRATMKGNNVLKVDDRIAGQGPVRWQYIAIGKKNPNDGSSMVEIVLYAENPVEVK